MWVDELAVAGALKFTPQRFPDERGVFASPFQAPVFQERAGKPLFPIAQSSLSVSRRGVVRGLHFTLSPPGMARYVHCPRGRALDIVVDVRLGSPTFGAYDSVLLDDAFRAVYLPVGVAHAFVSLEDDTVMSYLISLSYSPEHEHSLSVFDPAIGVDLPGDIDPIMSARDRDAMTLEQARERGLLPDYATCQKLELALSAGAAR
ncbi:epimerase EvaD [Thermocatellispora tengchongensis]|uniref:Epimerase EvaD n=1 Tax=Thermocatellispora tengchongensis TaxID=1073253 RepID=A0A840PEA8_9ACTN|nr:dTDP-4-dehydrorhamnose 3,5-epimerase family protein [Thermocatellispora tengchongensis]MBB5137512.1 epimerase EvaD [Thermocatellispora tengchongensis]